MISFPLYCKSIKQINCFKRQTPNILSSAASKSFVKAAEQAGRQCSQVIRQDVRLEVAAQPEALCQNRGKRLNVFRSSCCFFRFVLRSVGQKCTCCNVGFQISSEVPDQCLRPSVKTAPSICQSPVRISILYLHSLQQNR